MGWLRELMTQREPPLQSFGRLAEQCLDDPDWPPYVKPQPRSLAALYSKFDRNIELEWLQDRPDAQYVLVRQLQCSAAEILRAIERGLQQTDDALQRWRVPDAPQARPILLSNEGLPPGLPDVLGRPARWNRFVWTAQSSAEIHLVGNWLQSRGLAAFVDARAGLTTALHPGPALVWVTTGSLPALDDLPAETCLVGVQLGPIDSPWQKIPSAPIHAGFEELVSWLQPRLPGDGQFNRPVVLAWLKRAAREGVVDGLHSALSLAATVDELALVSADLSWAKLAERLVQTRLQRASIQQRSEARWLSENALPALLQLMECVLSARESAWDAPRSLEDWVSLVPAELQQGIDVEWARRSLGGNLGVLSAGELDLALTRLPPGAYRLIRGLEAAGLLTGTTELQLAPRWLCLWLRRQAQGRLLQGPVSEWGAALLQVSTAQELRDQLSASLRSNPARLLDRLLDQDEATSDAAYVLALETLVELAGTAILRGEQLELEQVAALWRLQANTWVQLDAERVLPRLLCGPDAPAQLGSWLLANWALSEPLAQSASHASLSPWSLPEDVPEHALDCVLAHLEQVSDSTLRAGGWAVVERLFERCAAPPKHPLFWALRLLTQPTWSLWLEASTRAACVQAAFELAASRAELAEAAWGLWSNAGKDPAASLLDPRSVTAPRFWPHLPVPLLTELIRTAHPFAKSLPYPLLSADHFRQLILLGDPWPAGSLNHLPAALLNAAIDALARREDAAALSALWAVYPEQLARAARDCAAQEDWPTCGALLSAAPAQPNAALLEWLKSRLAERGISDPLALLARQWLQSVAARAGPQRLEAYAVLDDIETRLKQLRGATGASA